VTVGPILGPMKIPLAPVDPLGETLHFLRMTGVMYCRAEFTAPWALALPAFDDCLMFHVVTLGRCLLEVDGCEDHVLQSGQFALVPHGTGHRLTSEHGVTPARLFDLPREQVSDRYEISPAWRRRRADDNHWRSGSLRSPRGSSARQPTAQRDDSGRLEFPRAGINPGHAPLDGV
jgi:hypothetical protein